MEPIRTRYDCITECFKSKYRLSRLFYSDKVQLKNIFNENESLTLPDDRPMIDQCSTLCNHTECESFKRYGTFRISTSSKNRLIIETEKVYYEGTAVPIILNYLLLIHLINLVGLLFGITMIQVIEFSTSFIYDLCRMRSDELKFTRIRFYVKSLILSTLTLVFVSIFISVYLQAAEQVEHNYIQPNETDYTLNLCFPLYRTLRTSPYLNVSIVELWEIDKFNGDLVNLTLKELDDNTFDLDHFLVNHDTSQSNVRRFYFFTSKCFQFDVRFREESKELKNSSTKIEKLEFNLTTDSFEAYLHLPEHSFSTLVPRIMSSITLHLLIERRSEHCLDNMQYRKGVGKQNLLYDESVGSCSSQIECIEKCYLYAYVRKHRRLPFHLIVEDDFDKFKNYTFQRKLDTDLEKECEQNFSHSDCNRTHYIRFKIDPSSKLDLDFKKLIIHRPTTGGIVSLVRVYSLNDVTIDLFNLLSGLGLVTCAIGYFKNKNADQMMHLSIRFICVLFFGFHFSTVLASLNDTFRCRYFEERLEQSDLPFINVCVDLDDESIIKRFGLERNRSIRYGSDLEEQTKQITIGNLVDEIEYLDENYQLKRAFDLGANEQTSDRIEIDRTLVASYFYLKNMKCISFDYKINPSDIRIELMNYMISFKFKSELKDLTYHLLAYHRQSGMENLKYHFKSQFSESYKIKIKTDYLLIFDVFEQITFEPMKEFKLRFLKQSNQTTLEIPIRSKYLNYRINDLLFNQTLGDLHSTSPPNGLSTVLVCPDIVKINDHHYNLRFQKDGFKAVIRFERKKNYNTIFIELFSCTSTWFNLCLFDLINLVIEKSRRFFGLKFAQNQIGPM